MTRTSFRPLLRLRFVAPVISTVAIVCGLAASAVAQSVCLPAPRLLTTMPMGGQVGTEVEVTITGDQFDDVTDLVFSDTRISAKPVQDDKGQPIPLKYRVTIAAECPSGVYEARVMTRLGLSSSRIFSVGTLQEVVRTQPNTTLATALDVPLNSVCNAFMSTRAVDHFRFDAKAGQRVIVDCATRGIDSKLDAVVIIADAAGRDLLVERRGGALDFTVPANGQYVIKLHELTYKGGPEFFYRLGVWEQAPGTPIVRQPGTRTVNSFSWPPTGLATDATLAEVEPNNEASQVQAITLPCDVAGSFFPAADVDVYEFAAKKGEEWWVEVASERFGLPTDPAVLVQRVVEENGSERLVDVVELSDIPSPVKVSSNGYAYDGPPYNSGTSDVLGKLVIPEDGRYRLQLLDLFGGTRNDPRNVYRLVIRQPNPDFALVGWALHMELRNGDRNALSKPVALRGGATMALEVVAFRRDGFDGDIDIVLDGLPEGVTAEGLKIAAGQSRGLMLITAHQNAPRGRSNASFTGRASINGEAVTRTCHLASMSWPITDAWGEFPRPRLVTDVPVSVSGIDFSPLSIAPQTREAYVAHVGEKLTIPLNHTRRSEFSGATMELKTMGAGFERHPMFTIPLTADQSETTLDLAALKTPPGEYLIAFYGSAVAKYRHHPEAIETAAAAKAQAEQEQQDLDAEVKQLTATADATETDQQAEAKAAVDAATARLKAATEAVAKATEQLKRATEIAQPKDIVDIVVSEPIAIRILPAESK
ncbi:serine protease [bacterium]|nr:serine protease [bacterium]